MSSHNPHDDARTPTRVTGTWLISYHTGGVFADGWYASRSVNQGGTGTGMIGSVCGPFRTREDAVAYAQRMNAKQAAGSP